MLLDALGILLSIYTHMYIHWLCGKEMKHEVLDTNGFLNSMPFYRYTIEFWSAEAKEQTHISFFHTWYTAYYT